MVYPHMYRTEKSETRTTNSTYGDYYQQMSSKKIGIKPKLLRILQYMDSRRSKFLSNLEEIVSIKSISDDIKYKSEVIKMIKYAENWLKEINFVYECFNIGTRMVDGKRHKLLPVILGTLGTSSRKKTVFYRDNDIIRIHVITANISLVVCLRSFRCEHAKHGRMEYRSVDGN